MGRRLADQEGFAAFRAGTAMTFVLGFIAGWLVGVATVFLVAIWAMRKGVGL